jgi:RNA polymerase primary sigma factor
MHKTTRKLEQKLGRTPTLEELADKLDTDLPRVQWMIQVSWLPLSLESPVGDEEDSELGMFIEDTTSPGPAKLAFETLLRERIETVLDTLTPREARILRLRFGLVDGHAYTLEEIGQKIGVTRERIRQIEKRALRRLRHPRRSRPLLPYTPHPNKVNRG